VYRIDPTTNRVTRIRVGNDFPAWLAATDDAVWVSRVQSGKVSRIDTATNRVAATIDVGSQPVDGIAGPDGLVWIPNRGDNTVTRIDPKANAVVDTFDVGPTPFVLNVAFGDVWAASYGGTDVWRLRAVS
jgi:YVTN family beta-propeller protein